MKEPRSCRKISLISTLHYVKLFFRSALLIAALVLYLNTKRSSGGFWFEKVQHYPFLLVFIWVVFAAEMISRCFPSKLESMGCQKQFVRNYVPVPASKVEEYAVSWKVTFSIVLAWFALNGLIGVLFYADIIDEGILLLVALAYSVCDMICILFFCPFQTWFLKNKCCGTCRIYNWDYAMMFTPFIYVKHVYTWSLLAMALVLLAIWEVLYHRYPERFYDGTNQSLMCKNCKKSCAIIKHNFDSLRKFGDKPEKVRS